MASTAATHTTPLEGRRGAPWPIAAYLAKLPEPEVGRLRGVVEEIDEAIRVINWNMNVRYQDEINNAATLLRDWVTRSIASLGGDV